jgi:hypothetical protein
VTYRTVRTNTVNDIFLTQNGINYIVQYDPSNGSGRLIQANAPSGTLPIYQDGRWNASATQIGLTQQQQSAYHSQIQQLAFTAYRQAGGTASGAVLAPWFQPSNFNQPPGQTSSTPAQNPSSSNNGSGNALDTFRTVVQGLTNLPQLADQFSSNGAAFGGAGNDSQLFSGTMMYPMDMNIEQQDTLQITGYRYRSSRGSSLFGGLTETRNILTTGFQTQSNFNVQQRIGLVILPMPNKVADSNNVGWDADSMNNLSAAATAAVLGDIPGYAGAAALGGAANLVAGAGSASQGVFIKSIADLFRSGGGSAELSTILGSSLASRFLKMGGYGVETESILARGVGIIPNSNMELLFKGPTLRTFTFTYKLSPREPAEASRIRRIIRFFKQSMAAKKITATGGAAGQASFFLGTPNIFTLEYKTNTRDGATGQLIDGVNRFKTCALSSFQCDYTPDGFWAAYESGQPVSTVMSMTFNELEPIYDTDYQDANIFSSRTDLQRVNPESIGY